MEIIDNLEEAKKAVDEIIKRYGSIRGFFEYYEITFPRGSRRERMFKLLNCLGKENYKGEKNAS